MGLFFCGLWLGVVLLHVFRDVALESSVCRRQETTSGIDKFFVVG